MIDTDLSIIHIAAPQITTGGDFVYRLMQPDSALGRIPGVLAVSITNICSSRLELLIGADVLVIQLLGDPDLLPVALERRRAGRPTVFEISDNFLDFQPTNPATAFYERPENRACILQLISECDAVQTTVPALADMFSRYNDRIEVFENQMDSLGTPGRPDGPLVVGWGGSAGHYEDIREAAPALLDWLRRRPEAHLAIMGDKEFKDLFRDAPRERFRYTPPGTLEDYYDFVQTLHVGIAPLKDDPFNLCRSDVKFMEYASRGVAPVCSNVPTYNRTLRHGETGLLFGSVGEMIEHLDALADEPELLKKIGNSAHDYIRSERTEGAAAQRRLDFYRSLLSSDSTPGAVTEERLQSVASLERTAGSRHFLHRFSDAENHAYNGLVYQFMKGDPVSAEKSYRAATGLEPDFFQAQYYLGGLLLGGGDVAAEVPFRRALETWPGSCEARMGLATLLRGTGKAGEALDIIHSVQADYPLYAPAFQAEAELLFSEGKESAAVALLERAIEANPYYAPAYAVLGATRLESRDSEAAEKSFRKAIELAPRMTAALHGLAAALYAMDRESEAVDVFIEAIELDPEAAAVVESFLELALTHYKSGDIERADELVGRALGAGAEQPVLLFWMARIAERGREPENAKAFWKRLAEADNEGRYSCYYSKKLD